MHDPCPPGFGSFLKSRGFYHRIALALPFGLASTCAGVWQCRPAVTSSGRFAPQRAIPRPGRPPSFTGPLHQPGAGLPTGTDEMSFVPHLPSHGASWRRIYLQGIDNTEIIDTVTPAAPRWCLSKARCASEPKPAAEELSVPRLPVLGLSRNQPAEREARGCCLRRGAEVWTGSSTSLTSVKRPAAKTTANRRKQ